MDEQARAARPPHAMAAPALMPEADLVDREDATGETAAPGVVRGPRPVRAVPEDERLSWPAVRRGFLRRCPHCGEGHLFDGYLKVTDTCASCGEVLRHHRADDGPAYVTILIVGHILGFVMHFVWVQFRPDPMVFATLLTVLAVGMSLWLLPRFKGAIVAYQWAHRMHGFGRRD